MSSPACPVTPEVDFVKFKMDRESFRHGLVICFGNEALESVRRLNREQSGSMRSIRS